MKPVEPIPEPPPKRPEGELPRCGEIVVCKACNQAAVVPSLGPYFLAAYQSSHPHFKRTCCQSGLSDGGECLAVSCDACGYIWYEKLASASMSEYDLAAKAWHDANRKPGCDVAKLAAICAARDERLGLRRKSPVRPKPRGIRRLWVWVAGRQR